MTSNLGSDLIQERFGELDYGHMKDLVLGVVSQNFRPEFINRIDEIIVFNALDEDMQAKIAHKFMNELTQRLQRKDIRLQVSDESTV